MGIYRADERGDSMDPHNDFDKIDGRVVCLNQSPPWWSGTWREWHRGHGCAMDDGKATEALDVKRQRDEMDRAYALLAERLAIVRTQRDELLAALKGLRALILAEFAYAYECVDGERADAVITDVEAGR